MASRRGQRRVAPSRAAPLHILLIALGLLFAQVPSLLHLLLVPHATCEHGDLVEQPQWGAGAPASPGVVQDEHRSDRPQVTAAHGSGHDHCDALAVRHRLPEVGVSVAAASLLSIEPVAERGERGETRPVPLLSLAPKSSPPVTLRNARERSATVTALRS